MQPDEQELYEEFIAVLAEMVEEYIQGTGTPEEEKRPL